MPFGDADEPLLRALQVSADRAAALAEVARFPELNPGPVLRVHPDLKILLANKAARNLFGDDIVGTDWSQLCPPVTEAEWAKVLSALDVVLIELRIKDCDYIFSHRYDETTRIVFVFGSDVTKQRLAERALRQSERMATLGTLAAGVAHELNNPAAATRRASEQLREAFAKLEQAHLALEGLGLSVDARARLRDLDRTARARAAELTSLSALDRSDLETEMEDWLEGRVDDPSAFTGALVDLALTPADVDALATLVGPSAFPGVLAWIASVLPVHVLLYEIGQGASRISEIVRALKSYSFLGQAPVQWIDLHEGLDNTLVILRSKMKTGVEVHRDYCTDMPHVQAYGSELNQVWTNILDNATDAMGGKGTITIRTKREGPWAVVEIEDNGPGIPKALQSRVFDPFFTTKAPGKGTGLGLSTSYSIITEKHGGQIEVESRPGFTKFTIRLPIGGVPDPAASGSTQQT